jgi:hypothetical protein
MDWMIEVAFTGFFVGGTFGLLFALASWLIPRIAQFATYKDTRNLVATQERLREVERIEGERLEAERKRLERMEHYRAERERQIAQRAEEDRVAKELEIANKKLAVEKDRVRVAAERLDFSHRRRTFLGRHQLLILMICLLSLIYWAFASV